MDPDRYDDLRDEPEPDLEDEIPDLPPDAPTDDDPPITEEPEDL